MDAPSGTRVPDEWADRLTATTDAEGVAALTYLPQDLVPLAVRIAGNGFAPHLFPFESPQGKDLVIKLGRPGRVVGIVRSASGEPMAGVPVEVWVQGAGTVPGAVTRRRITPDAVVQLDPRPMKTGPQGAFQTPPTLLGGSSYRVAIRQDGFAPFVSDWVKLDGERATIPDIRLQPLRSVTGRIQDRQGRAVAGARVFLPAGGPATATDAAGRFTMAGLDPGKAVILVEQAGFRLQGWPVDPSAQPRWGLSRWYAPSEAPGPVMSPMADPIPPEESRALADRLLEPYLPAEPEKGDDRARLEAISVLSEFDMARALELLQDHQFRDEDLFIKASGPPWRPSLRRRTRRGPRPWPRRSPCRWRGPTPSRSRPGPFPPRSVNGNKPCWSEPPLCSEKVSAGESQAGSCTVSAIAEQWLDLGERERARLVLGTGEVRPGFPAAPARVGIQVRVLDPTGAARARPGPGAVAEVAASRPGDDRLRCRWPRPPLGSRPIIRPRPSGPTICGSELGSSSESMSYAMRLCRRLARVDPPCARRDGRGAAGPGGACPGLGLRGPWPVGDGEGSMPTCPMRSTT